MGTVTIGAYNFSVDPSNLVAKLIRQPGQLKVLGRNISIIESMGTEGLVQVRFNGYLIDETGVNKKTDLTSLYTEYSRNEPVQIIIDMFSTKAARGWGFVNEFNPIEVAGRVKSYEYQLAFTIIGFSDKWSRATIFTGDAVVNDFNVTGDKVVTLPITASGSSETIDFNRGTTEGNIPCVVNPQLSYCKWEPTGSVEAWLSSGSLEYWCSGSESGWSNKMLQFVTSQDENTRTGMLEVWVYTGSNTSMEQVGWLETQVQTGSTTWFSGSNLTDIVVKSAPANKFENKYHTISKIFYPTTTTGNIKYNVFLETWRGKPFGKFWIENATENMNLTGCRYRFIVNTGSAAWQNFTAYRSGSSSVTLWGVAGSGSYLGISGSGANDSLNSGSVTLLSTDYPLVAGSNMVGFIRPLKDTMNHIGVQGASGSYWSEVWVEYTGSGISYGNFFPEVFLFTQNYGSAGSRTELNLADEALYDLNCCEDIVPLAG